MKYFTLIFLLCCAALVKQTRGSPGKNADAGSSSDSSTRSGARTGYFFQGEKHVKFYLHNYKDLNKPHAMKFNSTINSKWVNFEWQTVLFIHGWRGGKRMAEVMKNAYLEVSGHEVNLIEVDWLEGASNILFFPSANRVAAVGETVAKFLGLNLKKINLENLVIVGHSLGAHAAGFAGKYLQSNYGSKPHIIVGLDPAGPNFHDTTEKLQPTDAQEVLVIHTNQVFGHLKPLGTYDVYINGGKGQPGCTDCQSHGFAKLIYKELVLGKVPLIGHPYTSFADVVNDVVPETAGIALLHGAPKPSRNNALIYISTQEQPELVAEVKRYIDSKLERTTECCSVM